ncbi:uncharacterized protein LOC133173439 [Saccostrea echinata]|uniref:uncharacterized protein LOC133173439 n=1 Tax=Saccostrea echinata TaxID=191078 RepID=UPI002A83A0FB|nr:uncharacterized protein LOC133173439 [Saccostrea echinata]
MRPYFFLSFISIVQFGISQRFIQGGNFRSRKSAGHSGRFGSRSISQPWRESDWKTQYDHLRRHRNRRYPPWGPYRPRPGIFPPEDITRTVTPPEEGPGNPGVVQPNPPTDLIASQPSLRTQFGDIYCAICCRVPWYHYNNCVRRFCVSRGPNCRSFG